MNSYVILNKKEINISVNILDDSAGDVIRYFTGEGFSVVSENILAHNIEESLIEYKEKEHKKNTTKTSLKRKLTVFLKIASIAFLIFATLKLFDSTNHVWNYYNTDMKDLLAALVNKFSDCIFWFISYILYLFAKNISQLTM